MQRAVAKALARAQELVSISELAAAIEARDPKRAERMITIDLGPPSGIIRDAFGRGGRIGAKMVPNKEE